MKKVKLISAAIVLLGALISCICSILAGVSFGIFVKRLAITVIIFIVLAFIIEIIIEWNFPPMEDEKEEADTEGEETENTDFEGREADEQGERITDSSLR